MAETNGASEKIYVSEVLSRDATAFDPPPARESVRGGYCTAFVGNLSRRAGIRCCRRHQGLDAIRSGQGVLADNVDPNGGSSRSGYWVLL